VHTPIHTELPQHSPNDSRHCHAHAQELL
jgi:hypothetical protein